MERLIANNLLYGSLFLVDQPHLVERYNRALVAFGMEPTKLMGFGIDATGYSPEIASEFGDDLYLNPFGVNQRFILLSPDQSRLPVVQSKFTSTFELMQHFMTANKEALRVLTLKDVVYGEIEDSTLKVNSIDDLLSIRQVEFKVHTPDGLVEKAKQLTQLAGQFETEPDVWRDETAIATMLTLARDCGDIRRNQMVPNRLNFKNPSFWTEHFDGLYIFHDDDGPTVMGVDDVPVFAPDDPVPDWYLPLADPRTVFQFLESTNRLEPFNPSWLGGSGILDLRVDQFVRFEIAQREPDRNVAEMEEMALKNWTNKNIGEFGDDQAFHFLSSVRKAVANQSRFDLRKVPHGLQLLVHRANPDHPDRWLINRMISEFVPFDFLTRFIVNKDGFYRDYRSYPDNFRDYVVNIMRSKYLRDKAAFRTSLFQKWGTPNNA